MSVDIAKFKSIIFVGDEGEARDLEVTAFYGGKKHGKAVQFTVGREYTALSEQQVRDLIEVLEKRLEGVSPSIADPVPVYMP